jgi:hypothetical protein
MSLLVAVLLTIVSLLSLHAPVAYARHGEFFLAQPISSLPSQLVADVLEICLDPLLSA